MRISRTPGKRTREKALRNAIADSISDEELIEPLLGPLVAEIGIRTEELVEATRSVAAG